MKIPTLAALFVIVALLCGCTTSKFTAYPSTEIVQGTGGSERFVDGIDFWENGDPYRRYKILGIINSVHNRQIPLLGRFTRIFSTSDPADARDSAIAKAARKHGGDAVIFVSKEKEQAPPDSGLIDNRQPRRFKIMVVKYVN